MTESDLTLSILREIRDEVRGVNERLDVTNQRLDVTIGRLDVTIGRLDVTIERLDVTIERLDVTNERLIVVEHTVNDAAAQLVLLGRYIKNKHETAIDDLRERVTRLEAKTSD